MTQATIERAREIVASAYEGDAFGNQAILRSIRQGRADESKEVQIALAALRTAPADAALREIAWLIELGSSEPCNPRYWGGCHGWTYDHLKAVRFCREVDAQLIAEQMSDGAPDEYRLAEHIWVAALSSPPQPDLLAEAETCEQRETPFPTYRKPLEIGEAVEVELWQFWDGDEPELKWVPAIVRSIHGKNFAVNYADGTTEMIPISGHVNWRHKLKKGGA